MLFPTVEFVLFFIFVFGIYNFIKNDINKIISIVLFNLIFYSFSKINIFVSPLEFIQNNSTTIYLLVWSLLIYYAGKKLNLRFIIISFAVLQLIYWKSVEAGYLNFTAFYTPLGISFFTFQGLTYLFARMKLPSKDKEQHIDSPWGFWKTFAFIGFFPTVLSGPIMRARYWENNLKNPIEINQKTFSKAMSFIALGCFYKLCISSYLHDYVSVAFSSPKEETGINILIGMFAYTFEIYHDFAGYSLIAIGIALLLGFHIPDNFKQPYLSNNIRDFWQRWHISFSFWLRDYFYISALGGSRKGYARHLINIFIIMIVCGAWHGLSSNYLVWGFMHALALVTFHLTKDKISINKYFSWFITFIYISIAWVFFRSTDYNQAIEFLSRMFFADAWTTSLATKDILVILSFFMLLLIQYFEYIFMKKDFQYSLFIFNNKFSYITWGFIFIIILVVSPSGMPPFIYFNY